MKLFTILTVCTGNICRSPLAEQLLRNTLADLPVTVHSAGTRALVGYHMPETSQRIAYELGVQDPNEHVAKDLTLEHLQEADLILAMAREHRSAVVELMPRAMRKVFAVRELARISEVVEDQDLQGAESITDQLRLAVEAAAMNRGLAVPADTPNDDDVIDPYRRSDAVFEQSRDELVAALNSVTKLLRRAVR